ncbi:hypothetical protein INR49_009291 [Caranx melampygus]|nr:hypothetical protein INR49_009291 [Caranx melampygus]
MAASNYSLKVNRELLDPSFESYRLSLEPTPCYTVELDAVVEEVKLKDSHYTLEHMQAFGMYNYLHLDPWYEDSVLFVDCKGRVLSLTVTLVSSSSSSIVLPLMFMSLWISCLSAHCQRSCVSIGHDSDDVTLGFRSDDGGASLRLPQSHLLHLGRSVRRRRETPPPPHGEERRQFTLQPLFSERTTEPFTIVHSVSHVQDGVHSLDVLLLRVQKDPEETKGSGFSVSLEWITVANTAGHGAFTDLSLCRSLSMLHMTSVSQYHILLFVSLTTAA